MTDIIIDDLHQLLVHFSKNTYQAKDSDSTTQKVMQQCLQLADLDYTLSVIDNNGGDLSAHYPKDIIIFEYEKYRNPNICDTPPPLARTTETIYESMYDPNKLKDLIKNSKLARCRARFPLPVILYKGRHVCRSATLASGAEIYTRSGLNYLFPGSEAGTSSQEQVEEACEEESQYADLPLLDKVRQQDIKLLKTLNVGTIIDFMVEKKKVKYGVYVTSSEKVDKQKRYSDFTIVSLPYPGCEFFKEFRANDYIGKGLMFDWSQNYADAFINVPEDSISNQLRINWNRYQLWDLTKLTQNYLKIILRYLNDSSNGILIHCISGWDRTPLFISLLRISLWADSAAHTSLNAYQMLYFTIAYDWMLFGHALEDRISKGEEILFFCFYFLKYIHDEEFSVHPRNNKVRHPTTVPRNDGDPQLDNVIFDSEIASSNLSLNSWCSSASRNSSDSQDNNPPAMFPCSFSEGHEELPQNNGNTNNVVPWTLLHSPSKEGSSRGSRSSLPPARTSPVPVPTPSRRLRQRTESLSSGGSWQMISGTGSLRGSTTANAPAAESLASTSLTCKQNCETCTGHASQDSSGTIVEDELCTSVTQSRKERLQCLRRIFYNAYSHTVGFKAKEEPSRFSNLLGNFAEKMQTST